MEPLVEEVLEKIDNYITKYFKFVYKFNINYLY